MSFPTRTADRFYVSPEFQPLVREVGLDAAAVFDDPRVVAWRHLPDRQNCTLDERRADGSAVRLHVKRYTVPAPAGDETPAEVEVRGHQLLADRGIPTSALVTWGVRADRRSFTVWLDLAGYTPGDKLVEGGLPFERLLGPTADLAGRLHKAGLHHRDLYLCHFMAKPGDAVPAATAGEAEGDAAGEAVADVRLIDVARVRQLPGFLTRRRWVVKDLAQFWYSTTQLAGPAQPPRPAVTDGQRARWLARYATARGDVTPQQLRRAVERKAAAIARHDERLKRMQPTRNVSIPT
jgi:hypothetical protein